MATKITNKVLMKNFKLLLGAFLIVSLVGCSAVSTAVKKQNLVVESRLSHSVVLEPLMPEERIVYVKVHDITGNKMRSAMTKSITENLKNEGVIVTTNPKKANLMLDATILTAKKTTADEANSYLSGGYKGGAEGALLGVGIAGMSGSNGKTMVGAAVVGAAAGFFADMLVEDVYYTFVMDVQLRERPLEGDMIDNSTKNATAKGISSKNSASSNISKSSVKRGSNFNWIIHETRIVTTANKMNLDVEEAIPLVQEKTSYSLTELLL